MDKKRRFLWLGLVALLLWGCNIESPNPLGDPAAAVIDPDLPGIWYAVENEGEGAEFYAAIFQRDQGRLHIIYFSDAREEDLIYLEGFISEINGQRFLNLKLIDRYAEEDDQNYIFFPYDIDKKGQLVTRTLKTEFFTQAIEDGAIKGSVSDSEFFTSVTLDDSTQNLVAFIAKHKKEEYSEKDSGIFRRMKK